MDDLILWILSLVSQIHLDAQGPNNKHLWWIFALFQPIGFGITALISQHYKQRGTSVTMIKASFVAIAMLPLLTIVETPTSEVFFLATISAAVLAFIGDSLILGSNAKFGAGPTSRLLPMSPLVGFVVWTAVDPSIFTQFAEKPLIASGLVLSLLCCAFSVGALKKCEISRQAFFYLLPVIFTFGFNDVLNKLAQDNSALWSGVVWYIFLLALGSTIIGFGLHTKQKDLKETLCNKLVLKAGFGVAIFYLFAMVGRNLSMVYTANPAYTSIIAGATPLFIYVMHKIMKVEDKANVKAGLGFAISVATMIFLANML